MPVTACISHANLCYEGKTSSSDKKDLQERLSSDPQATWSMYVDRSTQFN